MSNPNLRAAEDAFEDEEDEIAETVARMRDETAALAEEVEDLPDQIKRALHDLEDRIADLYDVVADQAVQSAVALDEIVETRPWLSVGVAFAAGCLFTRLLIRPRRRW